MRIPSFLPTPSTYLIRGINHVLQQHTQAAAQLAAHAGKSLRLTAGRPLHWQASITPEGRLQAGLVDTEPDVVLSIPVARRAEILPAWQQRGLAGVVDLARIEGDAALAQVLSGLAATLRWDFEDDLARVVGDWPAVRLVQGGHAMGRGLQRAGQGLQGLLAGYLREESGLLAGHADLQALQARQSALRGALDGLQTRLRKFERGMP
ncbi:SCP2 domain-containing protein [Castellaniella sp.]|uniref:ubiquinone biosynthesis accessory factor UbiJ n=1 Tax=Castellaniella sp. TaxID=1955812 RepID=UPI003560387F